MNGLGSAIAEIEALKRAFAARPPSADVLVCPPAPLLARAAAIAGSNLLIGAQDCAVQAFGAFTGDVSAEMLKDAGCSAVIVGHSERRQFHGEDDALVAAKARAAWRGGLLAIICVGESESERAEGRALDVVARQIAASIPEGADARTTSVAYEPVWAIGSGKTPTSAEIAEMHDHIRRSLADRFPAAGAIRILYGGSVKPANASEILGLAEVGGALVGGASLKAAEFLTIIEAAPR